MEEVIFTLDSDCSVVSTEPLHPADKLLDDSGLFVSKVDDHFVTSLDLRFHIECGVILCSRKSDDSSIGQQLHRPIYLDLFEHSKPVGSNPYVITHREHITAPLSPLL